MVTERVLTHVSSVTSVTTAQTMPSELGCVVFACNTGILAMYDVSKANRWAEQAVTVAEPMRVILTVTRILIRIHWPVSKIS
jgi:hypothetical protein